MSRQSSHGELTLNAIFLKNELLRQGLKQWWLAEQLGVDRKTVSRWVNGKVKSIQKENAEALCQVLGCQIEQITTQSIADQLATPEDQKAAAQLIATSSLIEKLGPIGEWNVIESLLKATVVPDLPIHVLGELYNLLSVTAWRQSKIDEAEKYTQLAIEIGHKSKDKEILAHALMNQANIFSWRGFTRQAVETYEQCIAHKEYLKPKALGGIYSNIGATLYEAGDLVSGQKYQELALKEFEQMGLPMNFSIAHGHLSMIALQLGDVEKAEEKNQLAMKFAREQEYSRGVAFCTLVQGEIEARRGNDQEAVKAQSKAFDLFAKLQIEEGLNYEYAARIHRLIGEHQKALSFVDTGLPLAENFPVYQAALYLERVQILAAHNAKSIEIRESGEKAIELYRRCQCDRRVEQVKSLVESAT